MIKQVGQMAVTAIKAAYKTAQVCSRHPRNAAILAIAIDAIVYRVSGGKKGFVASLPESSEKEANK